jgi:hypothetical protein
MTLKINPWVATALIAGILILVIALFKGCHQSKLEVAAREKTQHIADSALSVLKDYKAASDSAAKDFQDTLELERGQRALMENQKEQTESALDKALAENKKLIDEHRLAQYADTSATVVPHGYIVECEDCFTKLETTTSLSRRYKNDLNSLQNNWDNQNKIYLKRFKELDAEKLGFYNKINTLAKEAKDASDKLKPHGRLYLSWEVLFGPWPKMAGGGFMYQTKYNMMYEANWLYGNKGHMVEASIKFPLSIKF